jgi:4,5-DOPA dioxygenase extradiol
MGMVPAGPDHVTAPSEVHQMTLPTLFLAHGAPDLLLSKTSARGFTETIGARFPDLRAILVIAAHWEVRTPTLGTAAAPETVYDLGGFDDRLYSKKYPAHASAEVIADIAALLESAGLAPALEPHRGYDHGVWIPMMMAFPRADVPVIHLSLRRGATPAENYAMGQVLAPFAGQGRSDRRVGRDCAQSMGFGQRRQCRTRLGVGFR